MKNRSRVEILYDIISAARSSAKKTHLMYKSNLSFKQLDLYLGFLLQQGLVQQRLDEEDAARVYYITPRGLKFLSLFEDLQTYMSVSSVNAGRSATKPRLAGIYSEKKVRGANDTAETSKFFAPPVIQSTKGSSTTTFSF